MTIVQLARMTEAEARTYFEKLRWPNGPECPHCKLKNVTRMNGEKHRDGAFQCNDGGCRQQFTVTVGTVLESSKVELVKWIMAFHLICSSKKGFSALQLQRELGLGSYKTAWFMLHR
ncbi:MAG: transposase, partial [Planctomycetaceae bacterium]|nr:transposase [Planctomycetaceae bacterium]